MSLGENFEGRRMKPNLRRLRNRLRRKLAFVADSFRTILATFRRGELEFKSLRMCPFCGLITSRYKTCCLQCGKSLKPA